MRFLLVITVILCHCGLLFAEDYSFDIPEEEEKEDKLEWSGSLDTRRFIFHSDQSSPLYQLQFFGEDDLSEYLSQHRLELRLNADYQTKSVGFHLRTNSTYYNDSEASFSLLELYGNINPSLAFSVQMGKRAYNWGKGYAFNPVGYVNPIKDPENPELAQAGLLSMSLEKIKSFDSDILKNLTLTAVMIPPVEDINNRYAEMKDTDFSLKSYFLLWDVDVDVMGYYSGLNSSGIGFDFATNLRENIEIHGELSRFWDEPKSTIVKDELFTTAEDGYSYLLGLRYLNRWNTTIIAEYYHDDAGLTEAEYESYTGFLQSSVDNAAAKKALGYSQMYFKGSSLMQDYLYAKITQPEPFDWLYFAPSLFTIYNLRDNSFLLAISLSYKPFTNFELALQPTLLVGGENTEYGSRQFEQKIELRMKVYF